MEFERFLKWVFSFINICFCLYLKQLNSKGNKNKLAGIWRRPLIVKRLGIVSRIELAFFAMFIALLVWSFSTYLRISFAKITPLSAVANGEQVYDNIFYSSFFLLQNEEDSINNSPTTR